MHPDDLREAVANIKMWQRGDQRAPHKPLLLLYALGRLTRGEPRLMSYEEVKTELKELFVEFAPGLKKHEPAYPFIRLANDNIWELKGLGDIDTKRNWTDKELIDNKTFGGFSFDVHNLLKSDDALSLEIAFIIARENFTGVFQNKLIERLGIIQTTEYSSNQNVDSTMNTTSESGRTQLLHDKSIRLVEFMKRIAELQRKSTKLIENYPQVLWLSEIPKLKGCYLKSSMSDKDYDDSVWLEIQGRREPQLPSLPKKCFDWVDLESLKNKDEIPMLKDYLPKQGESQIWEKAIETKLNDIEALRLEDYPEIEKRWEKYIDEQWLNWKDDHDDWEKVNRVYKKLFNIYQEQLKMGEEYELVIGLGLLTWKIPNLYQVQRHVTVATAALEFDAKLRKFIVTPHLDGANLRVELDMLEVEKTINISQESINQEIQNANDDLWNNTKIEDTNKEIVHALEGDYYDRFKTEARLNAEKPIIELAPALILRKRSTRGLTEALDSIKKQLENEVLLPPEFAILSEEKFSDSNISSSIGEEFNCSNKIPVEIMFPKPANDEQRKIVECFYRANGVLVQGPPGTGKSHTIANLVCHLLSEGKRIIVTAKTPRALKVLEDKLPSDIKPLCVNLLGSGHEEKIALEKSIGAILHRTNNGEINYELIKDLETELYELRKTKASLEKRLRAIRESETHSQTIVEGAYCGTASRIACSILDQEKQLGWLKDNIYYDTKCPIENHDAIVMIEELKSMSGIDRKGLKLYFPKAIPTPIEVGSIFETEKLLNVQLCNYVQETNPALVEYLSLYGQPELDEIIKSLQRLNAHIHKLKSMPYDWINDAILDLLKGQSASWQELYNLSLSNLKPVEKFAQTADEIHLSIPPDLDIRIVYQHAKKMYQYLADGGRIKWGILNPPDIRPLLYLTKDILVNGTPCRKEEDLITLIKVLSTKISFGKIKTLWGSKIIYADNDSYVMELSVISPHVDALSEILLLNELSNHSKQQLIIGGEVVSNIDWSNTDKIADLIKACECALANKLFKETLQKINDLFNPIRLETQRDDAHPIVFELLKTVKERDISTYRQHYKQIEGFGLQKEAFERNEKLLQALNLNAPNLVKEFQETIHEDKWYEWFNLLNEAWNRARAQSWLNDYLNKDDLQSINYNMEICDKDIADIIARIASEKAWGFCIERMSEPDKKHKEHMELWQFHIKKYGKGTGKHAPHHRREARNNLEKCRDAVPAWVMPLHRVWDTINPLPGMFDVIIVDEASQCGLESLPLLFMSKKIIVVGDDKQISPEAVGISQNAVFKLMDELLYDFEFKTSFDITSSLFDQAKMRYGANRIALREHFRCMPEIIRFSNDLCYSNEPLIPLRQYGSDRLEPLKRFYVEKGFREGNASRVINKPEAEKITDTIVELCSDPKYKNKTMGVVVLQGEAQASVVENMLLERIGAEEMGSRRIICGNPYAFQGDERDIIFLSMVAAPNARTRGMTKESDRQRLNVATSRAKDQLWLFHSIAKNDLSSTCYRYQLLEFFEYTKIDYIKGIELAELERSVFEANRSQIKPPKPFDSWFEVDVALELARNKYRVIPQHEVAGKYIDLVVDGGAIRIGVECDGEYWHGVDKYEEDMNRQRKLERCGWNFFRIREAEFYASRLVVLDRLFKTLDRHGIYPINHAVPQTKCENVESSYGPSAEKGNESNEDSSTMVVSVVNTVQDIISSEHIAPENIHEAMHMKYPELRDAIIATLKLRPNQSCVKDSVVKYLLKNMEINSRGKPRDVFMDKANKILNRMVKAGILKEYVATNKRVKLVEEPYLSMAMEKDSLIY